MQGWYLLIHRIPPKPLYLRAKVRQRLANVGAVALKKSVYVLPQSPDTLEDFQWIAEEIRAGGGEAHVFEGAVVSGIDSNELIARFRAARDREYEALAGEIRAATNESDAGQLAAQHARLRARIEDIHKIDFFPAAGRAAVEDLLSKLESRIRADRKEEGRMMNARPELHGKTWTTRPGVKVDRIASAWFVRRFIDPKARFRFVDPATPRASNEVRFDMVGGDFTHEDDRCTLETLVRRVGASDRGVKAIAEIVHDIDLKDEKYGREETAGVRRMIEGLIGRYAGDDERIEHGITLFDDLHEALRPKAKGKNA